MARSIILLYPNFISDLFYKKISLFFYQNCLFFSKMSKLSYIKHPTVLLRSPDTDFESSSTTTGYELVTTDNEKNHESGDGSDCGWRIFDVSIRNKSLYQSWYFEHKYYVFDFLGLIRIFFCIFIILTRIFSSPIIEIWWINNSTKLEDLLYLNRCIRRCIRSKLVKNG